MCCRPCWDSPAEKNPVGESLDGIDLSGVLRGKTKAPERTFYLGQKAVISQQWKLIDGRLYRIDTDPTEQRDVSAANPAVLLPWPGSIPDFEGRRSPGGQLAGTAPFCATSGNAVEAVARAAGVREFARSRVLSFTEAFETTGNCNECGQPGEKRRSNEPKDARRSCRASS